MYSRTQRVVGKENLQKIKNSSILVLGVGGVGGYVVEMLCRIGVGSLTIVDFDKIDVSNINRQIIATTKNIGFSKVDEFEKRIIEINPNCKVNKYNKKLEKNNICNIINNSFDFVVDAIDDITAKVEIAKFCLINNINLISSMGTGNRYKGIPQFEITDISKTSYDKLAKKMRKFLKDEDITHLQVCYTKQPPEETQELGSVVYYPIACAVAISSYVINKIIEK